MSYTNNDFRLELMTLQDFESNFGIVVGLDEKKTIQVILKHYESYFVTYKMPPGIYSIKDN